MDIILYTILFCFVLFLVWSFKKIFSVIFHSVETISKKSEEFFLDTEAKASERYYIACEILEKYKPLISENEYVELENIIKQANLGFDINKENSVGFEINLTLKNELGDIKFFINYQESKKNGNTFWDEFLEGK